MIITIDGPAGVGKSTIAKLLAKKLKISYFDTGAMYRALTYALIKNKIDPENENDVLELLKNNFHYEIKEQNSTKLYFVNNEDVTEIIRSNYVTEAVSLVSAQIYVRHNLVPLQRGFAEDKDMVCEGRDMGTVVFPNADVKIYLTARASIRAERRFKELIEKFPQDIGSLDKNRILKNIEIRDKIDSTREVSPLKKAKDAYLIDTSNLNAQQVTKKILKRIKNLKKIKFLYRFVRFASKVILKIFYRYKVYGKANLLKGAAIITSNHVSFLDPPIITASIKDELYFLAKEKLFKVPIFKNIIRALNTLPISDKESNIQTFKSVNKILKSGKKVVLFPEGTRTKDGKLKELLPGVGFLINLNKCTIIPAYLHGAHEAWGRNRKLPKLFGKISCIFGSPIKYEEFENIEKDKKISYIVNTIEERMRNLEKWAEEGFRGSPP